MIKGGFQGLDISGVDLTAQSPTLPGAYAACQAADGKTVLVLTASGAVQCSVKKVSTNYVLAGITGDGKILSITIDSTDGIAVAETTVPTIPEEYVDTAIDIGSATSSAPYTTGYDGFVILLKTTSETTTGMPHVNCKLGPNHTTNVALIILQNNAPSSTEGAVFVKKGTILYCGNVEAGVSAKFYPYKPVES